MKNIKKRVCYWRTTVPGIVAVSGAITLAVLRPDLIPGHMELLLVAGGLYAIFKGKSDAS